MRHSFVYKRNRSQNDTITEDRLLNVEQVREKLNCSRSHVYKLIDEGKLEGLTIGGRKGKRVYESEVLRFLNALSHPNTDE